jgi:hypothetical protein
MSFFCIFLKTDIILTNCRLLCMIKQNDIDIESYSNMSFVRMITSFFALHDLTWKHIISIV